MFKLIQLLYIALLDLSIRKSECDKSRFYTLGRYLLPCGLSRSTLRFKHPRSRRLLGEVNSVHATLSCHIIAHWVHGLLVTLLLHPKHVPQLLHSCSAITHLPPNPWNAGVAVHG